MAQQDFDEIFIEEVPEWTDVEGYTCDGYTAIRATGRITVPELRKQIISRVTFLDGLLALEESGEQPAGIVLSEHSILGVDERGLFSTAVTHTVAKLISKINADRADEWGTPSVGRVQYAITLDGDPHQTETRIIIWADKAVARELVESGKLDLEAFNVGTGLWSDDSITEAFNECVGALIVDNAARPFYSLEYAEGENGN